MEESTNVKLAVTNKPLVQLNNLPLNIIKEDLHIIPDISNSLELIPRAKGTTVILIYPLFLLILHYITLLFFIILQTKLINYLR